MVQNAVIVTIFITVAATLWVYYLAKDSAKHAPYLAIYLIGTAAAALLVGHFSLIQPAQHTEEVQRQAKANEALTKELKKIVQRQDAFKANLKSTVGLQLDANSIANQLINQHIDLDPRDGFLVHDNELQAFTGHSVICFEMNPEHTKVISMEVR